MKSICVAVIFGVLSPLVTSAAEQPSDQARLREVQRLIQAGDLKRAGDLANQLVRAHPDSYAAYEALGRVRDEERSYQEAEAAYRRAIQLAPSAAGPHVSLGVSYVRRGLTAQAFEEFQSALEKEPNNLTALLNAAALELQSSQFSGAEDLYRRATQLVPAEPVALLGLATAAFAAGHPDLAQQTTQTLAGMDNVQVHFSLGLLFAKNSILRRRGAGV